MSIRHAGPIVRQPGQRTREPQPWTAIVSEAAAQRIAAELKARIEGEVRFDNMSRALYSTDASNYRQVPVGVVIPKIRRGCGGNNGMLPRPSAPVPVTRGRHQPLRAVLQRSGSRGLFEIPQPRPRKSTRQESWRASSLDACSTFCANAAEKHRLTFGPDPSTHDHNTLGGMLGNNSCGVHSVMAGRTADNVEELDIVTYRGLRLKVGRTPPSELRPIIAGGGARGEIYRRLADAARPLRRSYPPRTIPRFRAASPATIWTNFCPRTGSTLPARSLVPKAPASPFSKPR